MDVGESISVRGLGSVYSVVILEIILTVFLGEIALVEVKCACKYFGSEVVFVSTPIVGIEGVNGGVKIAGIGDVYGFGNAYNVLVKRREIEGVHKADYCLRNCGCQNEIIAIKSNYRTCAVIIAALKLVKLLCGKLAGGFTHKYLVIGYSGIIVNDRNGDSRKIVKTELEIVCRGGGLIVVRINNDTVL